MEQLHKKGGGQKIYKQLTAERKVLELMDTKSIQNNVIYLQQKSWRNSPRSLRSLARRVQEKCSSRIITQMRMRNGEMVTTSTEILRTMMQFYSTLYAFTNPDPKRILKYLNDKIPTMPLMEEHRILLESDFTEKEINSVIGSLHNNEAPGAMG